YRRHNHAILAAATHNTARRSHHSLKGCRPKGIDLYAESCCCIFVDNDYSGSMFMVFMLCRFIMMVTTAEKQRK
ncbi:MAG: hypothetical protein K2K22_10195, partial [Muribaculaceae bacterium]|nr:hypothetical protein [Muribaculaceae bacterium]